ncbi:MAG: inorganic phosphate transporter [Burkholderiaceae bacterium]|nr:inorganic phosphate transporter [Burkholderiaceae bacterium]
MEYFYLLILVFLLILACSDLFVGVSNDAVNFLSGALGSRVATFKTVMIVASLGVLFGATFSGGMMTIARTGVYNPEMFSFENLMLVFFAVVITEVTLLNLFNKLGLPTSTTVSIVFALMGGGVSMAVLHLLDSGQSLLNLGQYVNTTRASVLIFGIICSVPIAFVGGTVIQYLCRLLFTFNYQRLYRYYGALFGSFSVSAIVFFLLFKGAKGSALITPEVLNFLDAYTFELMAAIFVTSLVLFQVAILMFNFNVFKVVILAGTFALAFSFAGNDLVNFIGVPLAALDSWSIYQSSGLAPDQLMMQGLREIPRTNPLYLLAAGSVMVMTLWFSKKAMHVVRTTINLSASDRGDSEQFGSSLLGRLVVRQTIALNEFIQSVLPHGMKKVLEARFEPLPVKKNEVQLPFDAVRASINLVVSSILIASATALTLPLSTTYVTFMVAMGSSFADGAWDRESAVYRVSGVLTVIGGWFITALAAFTTCGLMVTLCYYGQLFAVIGLMCITVYFLVKDNFFASEAKEAEKTEASTDPFVIRQRLNSSIAQIFGRSISLFEEGLDKFFDGDLKGLKKAKAHALEAYDEVMKIRHEYYTMARHDEGVDQDVCHYYYRALTNMKEVSLSLETIIRMIHDHVANSHRIYKGQLQQDLYSLVSSLKSIEEVLTFYQNEGVMDVQRLDRRMHRTHETIDQMQANLLTKIGEEKLSLRSTELYLSILQLVREMLNRYNIVFLMQKELNDQCNRALLDNEQKTAEEDTFQSSSDGGLLTRLFKHR